jgi:hypothetical protein
MTDRMAELAWVPYHLDDLDADFARFYRCDWESLSGPRLMTRAQRVSAYGGVMTDRIIRQREPESAPTEDVFPPLPPGAVMGDLSELIEG